jgi:hypothetical protein
MYQHLLFGDDAVSSLWRLFYRLKEFYDYDSEIIHIHVQRMILKLILYQSVDPPNGFAADPRLYLVNSLKYGPSFANWLKKARQAMMIKSLSIRIIKGNETFIEDIKTNLYGFVLDKERYDYDSFFHEQHLIDFRDEADDFCWSFKEIEQDYQWLDQFRQAAMKLFAKYKLSKLQAPEDEDLATWISDSVTQTDEGPVLNRKLMRQLALDNTLKDLYESSKKVTELRFKRQSVHVAPGNARDTWQCYPETLFKVKRVSHFLRQILEPLPNSAMASPKKAWRRRKRMNVEDGTFFMFDYKKCGLTVNRQLLKIIGEELSYLYPDSGVEELLHFEHISVKNGDTILHPPRGVGLGNCNEGITLIQCVLGSMIQDLKGLDSVFFNDDGIFVSRDEDTRSPFSWIFTVITKLGMIINLKKTIISDCNVFCEDYFITKDNMSYEKVQSLIVPFANTFFQGNISQAKVLYHNYCEGIIGRNVDIELSDSLTQWWGYEFHPSEVWWPFEFGGWRRYGSTSINECIEAIYNSQERCPGELHGSIPYFREWAYYLVSSQKIREINRYRSNIKYRQFVENPFISNSFKYPHSEMTTAWLEILGMKTNSQEIDSLNDLYNIRGMKNAKPKIRLGKARKLESYRKTVWRDFRRFRYKNRRVFRKHPSDILNIYHFLRNNEMVPQMYEPPRFCITKWEKIQEEEKVSLGKVLFPDRIKFGSNDRLSILRTMESINDGYLKSGSRPDKLRNIAQSLENRPVVSNDRFITSAKSLPRLPEWIKLFFGKRKFAHIFYASKYKRVPLEMVDLPYSREVERSVRNSVALIFPNAYKVYWRLVSRARGRRDYDDILDTFHCRDYRKEADFQSALSILDRYITNLPTEKETEVDPNLLADYDHLLSMSIDDDLIEEQFGEKTFDDVLEDYIEYNYFSGEDDYLAGEDSDYEYELSPSRSILAAFKMPMDDDF